MLIVTKDFMTASMRRANDEGAYFLTDSSTFIVEKRNMPKLKRVFRGGDILANPYHTLFLTDPTPGAPPRAASVTTCSATRYRRCCATSGATATASRCTTTRRPRQRCWGSERGGIRHVSSPSAAACRVRRENAAPYSLCSCPPPACGRLLLYLRKASTAHRSATTVACPRRSAPMVVAWTVGEGQSEVKEEDPHSGSGGHERRLHPAAQARAEQGTNGRDVPSTAKQALEPGHDPRTSPPPPAASATATSATGATP